MRHCEIALWDLERFNVSLAYRIKTGYALFRKLWVCFAVSTEHGPSVTPFESNKKSGFTRNEIIIWGAVSTFLCILFTVAVICFVRRQRKRRRETNLSK